jgi:SAM-dependent methyltransferase
VLSFTNNIISQAESEAKNGAELSTILPVLRKLSLDDFGLLLISMPNDLWPNLSNVLPKMAEQKIQERYTGQYGVELLKQSSVFVRQIESSYLRQSLEPLHGKRILDFGCGYGRLIRMMYYYTNPSEIFAVDAEEAPLQICRMDGVDANFEKSLNIPNSLAVTDNSIDIAYSYSVFTHLPRYAAKACLNSVKKSLRQGGLFIITIAPVELWTNIGQDVDIDTLTKQHLDTGFAHMPHQVHHHYGWTSMSFDFLRACGWKILQYDRSLEAPLQIALTLQRS